MDQPRPRPDAKQDARPNPLIINHPELQSPLRRLCAFVITLLAWLGWVVLILPVLWAGAARSGLHLPGLDYFARVDSNALHLVLDMFPVALLMGLVGLGLLLISGLIVRLLREQEKVPTSSSDMSRVVTDAAMNTASIAVWQSARIVLVEHDAHGRVQEVRVVSADGTEVDSH